MRKLLLVAALFGAVATAQAEGYQINTLSARQNGMGHTGAALKLGSESQIFNPAGLGWLNDNFQITGSVTGIFAHAKATLPDGSVWHTDNNAATPMSLTAAWRVSNTVKAGLAFFTPYGSSINWTDNWPGAVLNQSVSLKIYTIQPTVAWQPLPGLSAGVGLMLSWGNVDLNKGLVTGESFDHMAQLLNMSVPPFGNTVPASVNLKGTARMTAGVNLGVMYDITDQWTVGFSFRSLMHMKVHAGRASVRYANTLAQTALEQSLGTINKAEFRAQMPCAAVYTFGVSYRPVPSLTFAFDAQLTGWNAYKELNIEFLDTSLSAFDQHITKNYKNAWTFHMGAEWDVSERFDVRMGLMVDTSPVDRDFYNPETPGMTKIEPSVGVSFSPLPCLSIDASFLYVAGLGADNRQCPYTDMIAGSMGQDPNREFKADYNLHSFCPSLGVTLSF